MFDDLWLSDLLPWGIGAVIVAAAMGFLPKSRLRFWLATLWTLLPALLCFAALLISVAEDPGAWSAALGFYGVFALITLPPWAALAGLSFNLVRRLREISIGAAD